MQRLPHLLLLAALLLSAVGRPSAALATPAPADAESSADESWQRLLTRTAELRGLRAGAEIPRSLLNREDYHARVAEQFADPRLAEQIGETARLYALLGLLRPDEDLAALAQRFRGDAVDGFFDPATGQVVVIGEGEELGLMDRLVAVHEYTHALQYQAFNLRRLREAARGNGDRSLALTALLEGDASWMMVRYVLADLQPDEVRALLTQALGQMGDAARTERGIPPVLRETMRFPYTEGVTFLTRVLDREALRGDGYGEAVNQLFAEPPQSTAQILHPERYLRGQAPVAVALGDPAAALGAGWHEADRGVLGELYHRLMLQQYLRPPVPAYVADYDDEDCADYDDCCYDADDDYDSCAADDWDDTLWASLPSYRAERAAEGWAGDSYALLESDGGQAALVVRTRWDAAAEATEWFDAYAYAVQARYAEALVPLEQAPGHRLWSTPDGALVLDDAGADTVLAYAPTPAQARLLAAPPAAH